MVKKSDWTCIPREKHDEKSEEDEGGDVVVDAEEEEEGDGGVCEEGNVGNGVSEDDDPGCELSE